MSEGAAELRVLVVDDELPSRDELRFLLRSAGGVGPVLAVADADDALRAVHRSDFDLVVVDIGLPGLSGLELARVLARFAEPPAVVFVTGREEHVVEAFEVGAVDYLLKPVRPERLEAALRRVERLRAPALGG